jgi:tRNA(Ile)-lysidine synthase
MTWFDDSPHPPADEPFVAQLRATLERWPAPAAGARVTVAFSGGVDSTVLLAALARVALRAPLRAVHVDHGLNPESAAWARHCAAVAADLGVPFASVKVSVARDSGLGLEGAAREARYAALEGLMGAGELLLTAHHGDDQLETLLLRLMRGTGVRGLRGVLEHVPFGAGRLARPLLGVTRAQIAARARHWGLKWLEDPANDDPHHDRSFLRRDVVPALVARWPAAARGAQRLAEQMTDAEAILDTVAERDAEPIADPSRVPRAVLAPLPPARQRNLLRHLLRRVALAIPSAQKAEELRCALLDARPGAQTRILWSGGEGRVFREHLYFMRALPPASPADYRARLDKVTGWSGPEGKLRFGPAATAAGLPESWLDAGLEVRFRAGGEAFRPLDRPHSHPLKRWFHDAAVVPWMRSRIPLLYRGDTLVAVADLWLSHAVTAAASGEPRWTVSWTHHPPTH